MPMNRVSQYLMICMPLVFVAMLLLQLQQHYPWVVTALLWSGVLIPLGYLVWLLLDLLGVNVMADFVRRYHKAQVDERLQAAQLTEAPKFTETGLRQALSPIIGQEHVKQQIIAALLPRLLGKSVKGNLLFSMLLIGATGVGKTESFSLLIKHLFGDSDAALAFIKANTLSSHGLGSLFGPGRGMVGSTTPGSVIQKVESSDGKLGMLIDEVEKGPDELFDLLLSVTDKGVIPNLTSGKDIDVSGAILGMTSNHENEFIQELPKRFHDDPNGLRNAIEDTLAQKFDREFIGRIDLIVVFEPLSTDDIGDIIDKALGDLCRQYDMEIPQSTESIDADIIVHGVRTLKEEVRRKGARPILRWVKDVVLSAVQAAKREQAKTVTLHWSGEAVVIEIIERHSDVAAA